MSTPSQTYYASIEPATGDVNGLIKGSNDSLVARYAYTPWGEIEVEQQLVSGVNSLRWKGLVYDAETGLYYMRARYYDPTVRRFISEDPIGLESGINVYAFVGGDPVNRSDPSGLDPVNNGFNQCWKLDYAYTNATPDPILYYVQVECPSSPYQEVAVAWAAKGSRQSNGADNREWYRRRDRRLAVQLRETMDSRVGASDRQDSCNGQSRAGKHEPIVQRKRSSERSPLIQRRPRCRPNHQVKRAKREPAHAIIEGHHH